MAGAFSWIYIRGHEARPWLPQGLRFGFAVALLTVIPTYIIYYVVQPMPGATVVEADRFRQHCAFAARGGGGIHESRADARLAMVRTAGRFVPDARLGDTTP